MRKYAHVTAEVRRRRGRRIGRAQHLAVDLKHYAEDCAQLRRSRLLDQDPRVSGLHAQRQCQRWRGWPTLYWHKGTCDLGIFKQLHDYKGGRRVDTSTACRRYRLSPCGGDWPQPACNPGADNEAAHSGKRLCTESAGHSVALSVPGAPTSAIVGGKMNGTPA